VITRGKFAECHDPTRPVHEELEFDAGGSSDRCARCHHRLPNRFDWEADIIVIRRIQRARSNRDDCNSAQGLQHGAEIAPIDGGCVPTSKRPMRVGRRFKTVEPEKRQNSEMIRRFLYDVVTSEFDRDLERASKVLLDTVNKAEDHRGYDRNLGTNSLKRAILDDTFITYGQISALAKLYNVPIAAILIFTRIRDELETPKKQKSGQAEIILDSLRAIIIHLEKVIEESSGGEGKISKLFEHQAFLEYVAIYRARHEQLTNQQFELPIK
jgi:hypothetical protein